VYPWYGKVKDLFRKSQPENDSTLRTSLLTDEEKEKAQSLTRSRAGSMIRKKKQQLDNDETEKDPLMKLGYGIVAYRNILWAMIIAFCVFSLMATPAILIYRNGSGYAFGYQELRGRENFSLGNLGYSSMQCAQIPVGIGILDL
jgi:hypothetical protein